MCCSEWGNRPTEASCQGETRLRAKQVLVFLDQKTQRATEIPMDVAKRMRHYLKEGADVATEAQSNS